MVYTEFRQFITSKIDYYRGLLLLDIQNAIKDIDNEILKNVSNSEYFNILNFIKDELLKIKKFNYINISNIQYPVLIKESLDIPQKLTQKLFDIYNYFILLKSIELKEYNTTNIHSSKEKIFLENSMVVLGLLTDKIIYYFDKGEINNVLLLRSIKDQIENMMQSLSCSKFNPSYGRNVVDSWIFSKNLGEELLNLKNKYMKL
ncbi:hypothetical protein [Endomicrobium proavitum]|uniref:Uncharacterized protein n=1 Tax=Endomicrobium proavitum TaxID=1408281 RepID=A0A0G3WL40_9BACT|nr:hypothetical protein [Endomicrobium proavitum]AKL98219.1 hypothetical protein Epro_0840 [Endomicrobium proavitum]